MQYDCFSLQTNLGPVLIAVNSFDQVQSKTGLLQSMSDNQRLQKIIQMVTSKLANSSTPQVIVLRQILHSTLIDLFFQTNALGCDQSLLFFLLISQRCHHCCHLVREVWGEGKAILAREWRVGQHLKMEVILSNPVLQLCEGMIAVRVSL